MRWLIKSDDVNCMNAMNEFVALFKKEYTDEIRKLRYRPIKKFLPLIEPVAMPDDNGVIFALPIKLPDFKKLRELIAKVTRRDVGSPKWQEKAKEMLEGYLKEKGVKVEEVKYIGD